MQHLSIKILNSQYKFVFNTIICLFIYACFKENIYYTIFCTNENIPIIAEPKVPALKGTIMPTPLQVEVSCFLNQAGIIKQQEQVILDQKEEIEYLSKTKQELIFQTNYLDTSLRELRLERDLLEIDKQSAERLQNVYKESYEQMTRHNARLIDTTTYVAENYKNDMNKAFKKGNYFGHVGLAALGLCIIGLITLKK